jgi:cAMP phosphodiesterase
LSAEQRAPAFELRALGVLGGDIDTNLSCYLLGHPGQRAAVMIDGGSVLPGIIRWKEDAGELARDASPSEQVRAASKVIEPIEALLLTHSHLDHLGGFIQKSTLDVGFAMQGKKPLEILSLEQTIDTVRSNVFESPLWADFTAIPSKEQPTFRLQSIPALAPRMVGGFQVQAVPITHIAGTAAFLIQSGDAFYLHLGDTGPTQQVWDVAGPLLRRGKLRAISIEFSYPSADEQAAIATSHLTRNLVLGELAKLAGVEAQALASDADAVGLAKRLAPLLEGVTIFAAHIKAQKYEQVSKELAALEGSGLKIIVPQQGKAYRF